MVLFVLDDVIENGDGAFVAKGLELLAVVGNVAALLDFKAAKSHANAAGAVGQRSPPRRGRAGVDRRGPAEFDNAAVPQGGVLPLRGGQVAQDLGAYRVGIALGQSQIGVVALHLGLPVAFKGRQDLFQFGAAHGRCGHGLRTLSVLASLMRIRHFALRRVLRRQGQSTDAARNVLPMKAGAA